MTDSDKANMIFKRYYPNEGKQNKKIVLVGYHMQTK